MPDLGHAKPVSGPRRTVAMAERMKQSRPKTKVRMMRERCVRTMARAGRTPTLSAKCCGW